MNTIRSLLPYFRRYRTGIAFGLTLVVLSNLFTVAAPRIVKLAVDALTAGDGQEVVLRYAIFLVVVAIVGGAIRYAMREILNGISRRIETDLRDDLFDHLLRLPPEFYDGWATGDLMSRATNDVQAIRMAAGPAVMYALNTATISVLAIGSMIWIDRSLTLLAMIPMVAIPPLVFGFGNQVQIRFTKIQEQFSEISAFAQENLSGTRIVKAYVQEKPQARRFADLNSRYRALNLSLARIWGLFHPSLGLCTGAGAVIALWFGGGQVIRGEMTIGDLVAFSFYLTLLMWPMVALGWVTNLFQRGAASMGRIRELFDTEPAIATPPRPSGLGQVAGRIEFRDVSFRYKGTDRDVVSNISFSIEPGQVAAIVGGTGSGKSTLAALIPRLRDVTGGQVLIDGVDVRDADLEELRQAVAFVPQEPFLFSTRLRANIEMRTNGRRPPAAETGGDGAGMNPLVATPRLTRAMEAAQLNKTLDILPEGIDTRLGERGVNLSGGQKQRATLARALYRDAPVLVLDDALSAVDFETEAAILAELRSYMAGRTSVIVSHRASSVRNADIIIVLQDGRVAQTGRHDQLMAAGGAYARLLHRQLAREELHSIEAVRRAGGARPRV